MLKKVDVNLGRCVSTCSQTVQLRVRVLVLVADVVSSKTPAKVFHIEEVLHGKNSPHDRIVKSVSCQYIYPKARTTKVRAYTMTWLDTVNSPLSAPYFRLRSRMSRRLFSPVTWTLFRP